MATQNVPTTVGQLKAMLSSDSVKARFSDMLGAKSGQYLASILSAVNSNTLLQKAEPVSIINSAMIAASLDLPVNANLGFAYLIPYKDQCQLQLGYKAFVQLAMRSGQYQTLTVNEVYEGEIKSYNKFTEKYEFGDKTSDEVVGYMAYFQMINGFEKYFYMSKEEVYKHSQKYSQTARKGFGLWKDEFDAMAKKTVLKLMLSKFGALSTQFQVAQCADQAVIRGDLAENGIEDAEFEYIDNTDSKAERKQAAMEAVMNE